MPKWSEEKRQQLLEIGLGIAVGLLFFLLSFTVPYQRLELLSLDARFNLRPSIEQNPDIATIDIDDRALGEEGRWQDWTRDKHARIINVIRKGGGALVGVDIYFSEESKPAIRPEELQRADSLEDAFSLFRDYDGELAESAKKAANVYWGSTFVLEDDSTRDTSPVLHGNYSRFTEDMLKNLARKNSCLLSDDTQCSSVPRALSPESFPIKSLLDASRGVGFAQIVREADGLVRKYPTFIRYESGKDKETYLFPSMALAMACDYLQVPLKNLGIYPGKFIEIPDAFMPNGSRKTLHVPIDERGQMIINWAGDYKQTFRHYPYSSLIQLGQQDALERIKHFLSLQDPSLYEQPATLMGAVHSAFPDIEQSSTYVAYLYGAHWYEVALRDGQTELTPSLFKQLFGMSPEESGGLYDTQKEVFENVRAHSLMLDVLSHSEGVTLEDAAKKVALAPEYLRGAYDEMKTLLEQGGPRPADKPLYFMNPVELEGKRISLSDLRGGVFFYGLTASGTHDLNPMPFNPRYPMVGAIANVFNTIVTGQFITPLPVLWKLPLFLLIGLFTGYVLSSRTSIRGSLFTLLFLVAYLLFAYWIFVYRRVWVDVVPVGIILISDASILWYKFNTAEKKRRYIRHAFEHYLDPTVVDEISRNPDMLELGGKEMELTAFFSDVAGFTEISEKLTAPQLVELLNEYLTAMTDILLSHKGRLDKYEGDLIMAVFGAPIHYPDHATKACLVALDMQEKLKHMREVWKAEGKPLLHARVGINSGLMVVGNMGSKGTFNYTVMGDAVNLASRLEGVNKQYSTSIMLSEFTYALCKSDIIVREVDLIRVKGKAKPVSIFEVLGRSSDKLPSDVEQAVELFGLGLAAYRQKAWSEAIQFFERALQVRTDDGPSLTYLNRCKAYLTAPPPDDWDGVYIMTSK